MLTERFDKKELKIELKIPKILNSSQAKTSSGEDAEKAFALHINAQKGLSDSEYYAIMLKNNNLDFLDDNGFTPLMYASAIGNYNIVRLLLTGIRNEGISGANLNLRNLEGRTALMFAANRNHTICVKLLLEHRPDLTIKDQDGFTAYEYAGREDIKKLVQQPGTCRACSLCVLS